MVTVALAPLPLQHHLGSHSPPTAMQHPTPLATYKGQTSTQRMLLTASKLPPPKSPRHQRQQQPFPSFASSSSTKPGAAARPGLALAPGEEPPFMLWPPNVITCKGPSWTATFGPCNANVPFHLRPSNRTSFFHFLHKKAFYCFCTCPLNSIASGAAIWQRGFYNVYYNVSTMAFNFAFDVSAKFNLHIFGTALDPRAYILQAAPAVVCYSSSRLQSLWLLRVLPNS